jgi:hypothetical protein
VYPATRASARCARGNGVERLTITDGLGDGRRIQRAWRTSGRTDVGEPERKNKKDDGYGGRRGYWRRHRVRRAQLAVPVPLRRPLVAQLQPPRGLRASQL